MIPHDICIREVSDADLLAAWWRDRDPIRPFDAELEADDAPNALVGVGLASEEICAIECEDVIEVFWKMA